jgi:NAD(P)-dependent dehydrogenase (short-subunit alcohol dehydrogenase family)
MEISNRVAVITGGGTGMGYAAAQNLAAKGARVALLGRREAVVKEKAELLGGIGVSCDIGDEDSVEAALTNVEQRLGTPSILINSAADGRMYPLVSPGGKPVSGDYIREMLMTNVAGVLYLARGVAARLARDPQPSEQSRGVIINVSSIAAADGVVGSMYGATKGALDAVGLSLAREFSQWAIRVVTIAPGQIETEMLRRGISDAAIALSSKIIPLRRLGRPDEFGKLALHVCENDYLNGCVIRLDGGRRIPFMVDDQGVPVGIQRDDYA